MSCYQEYYASKGLAPDPKTGRFKSRGAENGWRYEQPLRAKHVATRWVRACLVALDAEGRDKKGRLHIPGDPLYAVEYADGIWIYYRTAGPITAALCRAYPNATVVIEDVRGLS